MYFVYVVKNDAGVLYKGITQDLYKRVQQHNDGKSRWTAGKGPWVLVYREKVMDREQARQREKYLKSGSGREYLKSVLEYSCEGL